MVEKSRTQGQSNHEPLKPGGDSVEKLSALRLAVLSALQSGRPIQELPAVTGAPPITIGKEIAKLQLAGFLTADCRLTTRGLRALGL